ncbi:DUF4931 domain-containing protein [Bacillus sp. SM2101]|uniref:DUF4931 domain-containing protein n=1 Tax=Bacillus sp. SM2101 TaxID=2805366 RepID=UPI001BDE33FB
MSNTHLEFNMLIGANKPENIINKNASCPFCDRDSLENIIDEDRAIILLKNKYPVLKDAYQTVIIETDDCHSELSTYSKDHLYRLLSFSLNHWIKLMNTNEYQSVIFFKNHGPYSGGSLRHPHMQIVGLNYVDYSQNVSIRDFEGIHIASKDGVLFNISSFPRMGFVELNIKLPSFEKHLVMADYIQIATHYVLNHFHKNCNSYNLFFYYVENEIYAKVIPRFTTSPLFVGYSIPQVSNQTSRIAKNIQEKYFK